MDINPVVIAVSVMLLLSLMRINVVIVLAISALVGGVVAGMSLLDTVAVFQGGLGNGATVALSYAMLGSFAVAVSRSGITDILARKIIHRLGGEATAQQQMWFKYSVITVILLIAMASQNVIPVHIAFIPIVIPPLLHVFAQLKIDRRLIACVLTFGLITPYIVIPVGFGGIFLNNILLQNLNKSGLDIISGAVPVAMVIPALGMVVGLLIAIFFSYRKPRQYSEQSILKIEPESKTVNWRHIYVAVAAIVVALGVQLWTESMIVGALLGFIVFVAGGVIRWHDTEDAVTRGIAMMAMISFIMLAASGFAAVMQASGGVETLVTSLTDVIGENKGLAAFLMLAVGLLITMGIGSSFSTIPVITAIYVPLALAFGFSPMATVALVGTAAALGDAGSPVSDSTLGPTAGLNVDGQHNHIWDTVVPTFIHYNIPLLIFGWIAAMVL